MKAEQPSVSAEQVAAIRAAWSKRPEDERVCYDPLARHFLGPELGGVIDDPKLTETVGAAVEESTPGTIGCVGARTRYIDDYLKTCINGGVKQLVMLGAGYDSRPYRFSELKGKVKVFELDQPKRCTQSQRPMYFRQASILGWMAPRSCGSGDMS